MSIVISRAAFLLLLLRDGAHAPPREALPNDNRIAAGKLAGGVLSLSLEARETIWYPEGKTSPGIPIYGFAEVGKPTQVPGPLIRVPAGTEVTVTIRNSLPRAMIVRGLQDRQASQLDTFDISPGAERRISFSATAPGTYYYWGRTDGDREGVSQTKDAELVGAFVVDPPGRTRALNDRVFVVSIFRDTVKTIPHPAYKEIPTINGLSWPHTERLSYTTGDSVTFRVINYSFAPHPMHLHGFYFKVNGRGDAVRDTIYTPSQRRMAVTEFMRSMTTMNMSWVPTRPGNWLFHCHLIFHIARELKLLYDEKEEGHVHLANHALDGMSGLVMGINVSGRGVTRFPADPIARNRLRLFVNEKPNVYGKGPGYAFVLQEGATPPAADSIRLPSSTIVIKQNEPVEITVFNRAHSPVSIHWHGIELQSYYDGVGDWSGWQKRTAPAIMPGDSFVVRMTPDRSGTFIYHTHTDENVQLTSGLYGPLIVVDQTGHPNPNDRIMLMGNGGPGVTATPFFNGSPTPPPIELRVGTAHRIRFVNIIPAGIKRVRLLRSDTVQTWRAVAKDGYDLPPAQANIRVADFQSGPGETMDFEIKRDKPEDLVLEMTTTVLGKVISVVRIPVNVR